MLIQHINISYNYLHYKSTSNIVFDIIFIIRPAQSLFIEMTVPVVFDLFYLFPYGFVAVFGFLLIYYKTAFTAKTVLSYGIEPVKNKRCHYDKI